MSRVQDSNGGVSVGERRDLAETVRQACVRAALEAYEQAGLSGLCDEGRWEMAIDTLRTLDLDKILEQTDDKSNR